MIPKNNGFHYKTKDGVDMVEYHIDSHSLFQDRMAATEFGGNLSVRLKKGERPLISFGHDECIFKQFTMTGKSGAVPTKKPFYLLRTRMDLE